MAATAELLVKIKAQADNVGAELDKSAGGTSKWATGLNRAAGVAAGALAVIGKVAWDAAQSASRTEQAFGGLEAVFGDNSAQMKDWANNAADTMGLSASAYAEGAAKIGAQLKNLGLPMDQVAGRTNDLMQLAGDLAATYGGTTAEAVDALGAAFRGEADPAERYGLALNQTAVNAKMAADGTDKLTGKAKSQAKAAAVLALATEQAGGAIGQFARESDTAAGSAQIAQANWENARSQLGTALLPVLSAVSKAMAQVARVIMNNQGAFKVLVVVIIAVAAAILVMAAAQWVANLALLAFPGTWIVLAIIAVIAVFVLLWVKCEGFRNVVMTLINNVKVGIQTWIQIFQAVAAAVVSAWTAIVSAFNAVKAAVISVATAVASFFVAAWNTAKTVVLTAVAAIVAVVKGIVAVVIFVAQAVVAPFMIAWGLISKLAQLAFLIIRLAIMVFVLFVRTIAAVISAVFRAAWTTISNAARAAVNAIKTFFAPLVSFISSIVNRIKAAFAAAWAVIKAAAGAAASYVKSAWAAIAGPITAVINRIKSAFSSAWAAIKSAASSAAAFVKGKLTSIAGPIIAVANRIKSAFTSALNSLRGAASGAASAIAGVFRGISGAIESAIGAVQRLIGALSRIRVPSIKLPSLGSASRSATMASPAASPMMLRSSAMNAAVPLVGAGRSTTTTPGVVINVNGALDPENVARQLERILSSAQRRRSGVTLRQRAVGTAAAA